MRTWLKLSSISVAIAAITGCASIAPSDSPQIIGHQAVRHGTSASDAEAQYAVGKYYLGQNRSALALLAFTRAIEFDPAHTEAYNGRATAFVRLGDLDRAEADMIRALELSPRGAHLHNNLGYIRIQLEQYRAAAESLQRALEIEPGNERAVANWRLLSAAVSGERAFAQRHTGQSEGLSELRMPDATPSVVQSLSQVLSGPVVNLGAIPAVAANDASLARDSGANAPRVAGTRVIDLSADQPRKAESKPAANTVHFEPTSRSLSVEVPATVGQSRSESTSLVVTNALRAGASDAHRPSLNAKPSAGSKIRAIDVASIKTGPTVPTVSGAVIDVAAALKNARIEVSNGNGVRGMAAKFGDSLQTRNYKVTRISNAEHFGYRQTRIYFRNGYLREALQLRRTLAVHAAVMLNNAINAQSDLQLVVGKDLAEPEQHRATTRLQRTFSLALN